MKRNLKFMQAHLSTSSISPELKTEVESIRTHGLQVLLDHAITVRLSDYLISGKHIGDLTARIAAKVREKSGYVSRSDRRERGVSSVRSTGGIAR